MNSEKSYAHSAGEGGAEPTPQSFINRLMGVYFSPTETFQEIGRAPRVLVPIIVTCILTAMIVLLMVVRVPYETVMQFDKLDERVAAGQMTEAQAEQQRTTLKNIEPYMKFLIIPVTAGLGVLVVSLIMAGLAKLLSMMVGAENTFKQILSMEYFGILAVSIVGSILFAVVLFIKPGDEINMQNPLSTNLAALLPVMGFTGLSKFMTALLAFVDIFTIWKVILFGIGLAAVSKKLTTSTALIGTSAVVVIFAIGSAFWASMFG